MEQAAEAATQTPTHNPQDAAQGVFDQLSSFATGLLRPWSAYQVAIVFGLIAATFLIAKFAAPALHDWMRARENWPKWRLRVLVLIHKRLRLIIFALLAWVVVLVMREVTWPSRSYLIGLIATITTAWLGVSFLVRLIQNRFLRRITTWGLWAWVAVYYLGFWDSTRHFLDSLGLSVGEMRLSALSLLTAVVVTGFLFMGARFFSQLTTAQIRRNEDISPSMQVLLAKILQVLLFGGAIFLGLKSLGVDLTGLAVLSGAIGVGLGFGLQKVVSNLVSGFIILMDKSIKPGDVISLGDTFGWIDSLGARYVSVVTRDGREYLIPNEDLITNQVVNWSHTNDLVRLDIHFGTAYHDDPHTVRKVAVEAAKDCKRVRAVPAPVCHIVGFGDSSVDYVLRFWISDPAQGLTNIRGNVYLALWDAFRDNEISIPFPQREVKLLDGSTVENTTG